MPECGRYHKPVRICLSPEVIRRLDEVKERYGLSRSYVIEKLVREYLDDLLSKLVKEAGREEGGEE